MKLIACVLVAGCSQPAPAPAQPARHDELHIDGTAGAVCEYGVRPGQDPPDLPAPSACQAPLKCCYPCGIVGCASVCEAVATCPALP